MADQLADFPSSEPKGPDPQFSDDRIFSLDSANCWQLFFDGAAKDEHTPIAIKLNFETTNNEAEYEACAAGLEAALERNISEMEVYGDSTLIINQVSNKWKTIDSGLQKYHMYMEELIAQFKDISFHYLPRDRNRLANALAILASLVEIPEGKPVKPLRIGRQETPAYCSEIEVKNEPIDELWYNQIYQYLQNGEASFTNEDGKYKEGIKAKNMMALKRLASHFVILGGMLYKKRHQGPLLRCVNKEKAIELMNELHNGTCGPYMNARALT